MCRMNKCESSSVNLAMSHLFLFALILNWFLLTTVTISNLSGNIHFSVSTCLGLGLCASVTLKCCANLANC